MLRPSYLVPAGLGLVLAGFVHDMRFAGLPHQDPPPDLQATWLFHKAIAEWVIAGGFSVLMSGVTCGFLAYLWRTSRRR